MEQQGGNQGNMGFGQPVNQGFGLPQGAGAGVGVGMQGTGASMSQQKTQGMSNMGQPNMQGMQRGNMKAGGMGQPNTQGTPNMGQQFQRGADTIEQHLNNAGKQLNQMGNQFKETTTDLNWDYNKEGSLGFRLIAYAAVANLMFMCGLTTGLSIMFAVVAIVEKDKKLTRIVASMLATVLVLQIGVDLWDLIEVPLSASLGKARDLFSYGNVAYKGVSGLIDGIRFMDKIVNWLYHVALICIGMMNMKKITTGTYKTSKYITKYF